jgi:hypothetical protein
LHNAYQAYSAPPEKSPRGPVSILFSTADRQAYLYRNGVEIGGAQIGGVDAAFPSGNHVYSPLAATDPDGSDRHSEARTALPSPDQRALAKRLIAPQSFLALARTVVSPGTTLIVTGQPVNGTTHSGSGFNYTEVQRTSANQT